MTPKDTSYTASFRLTDQEAHTLRCVAAAMIPPDDEYGMPGADDPIIFSDVLRSIERDGPAVRSALQRLNDSGGSKFEQLAPEGRTAAILELRDKSPALSIALVSVVARCYYRDDRVMRAINMELRPPFPKGFEVEQGDWSLLEPVRARGKIYRDVPEGRP